MEDPPDSLRARWQGLVRSRIASDPESGVWPVGQDVALAVGLAARGVTVAGIVQAVCDGASLRPICAGGHLVEDGPLAKSHGTKYPILQGPMTRVSDTAAFAAAVAAGGGLPFLALALMRKTESVNCYEETKSKLGSRPWGVGILGFVPLEIRAEQLEAIRAHKPPYAIIAGGRPDQARELEDLGIRTYLHAPFPRSVADVSERRCAAIHLRGTGVRRAHRTAREFRALGVDACSHRRTCCDEARR